MGLYYPLKRSTLLKFFFEKNVLNQKKEEQKFFKDLLGSDLNQKLIFDVGANIGFKTEIFSELNARVICFEPDYFNTDYLKNYFSNKKNVRVENYALSNKEGKASFLVHQKGSGVNTLSPKWKQILENPSESRFKKEISFQTEKTVLTKTLDQAIEIFGKPYYIKIDVEGHEKEVVEGLTQNFNYISFEANLPEFKSETIETIKYLGSLNPQARFNYCNTPKFLLKSFVKMGEMIQIIKNSTLRYMEIYCVGNE